MIVSELMTTLSAQGVELWVEGDRLRFRAPKGALTPSLREELAHHKEAILAFLRRQGGETIFSYPLSHNQQALWFLKQADPENPAYNVAFTARICSPIDLPAFERACQALMDRHAMLRTTYTSQAGMPIQQVHGYMRVHFEVVDASGYSEEALRQQVVRVYQLPFDLERGPLLRVHLFARSTQDYVFLLTAHHIAADGWSIWLIVDELRSLYEAQTSGGAITLPYPRAKYIDYIDWQSKLLAGPEGEQLWRYWQQQLGGEIPGLNLPYDRSRPVFRSGHSTSYTFSLSEELTGQIKALAKAEGVTLYMALMAAFQILLYRYTGQEDIMVGSPMAGRSRAEFAELVGCFINPVILRAHLSGRSSFKEYLKSVRQTVLEALNQQDYPLRLLTERLRPSREAGLLPLFQVDFVLQKPQQFGELSSLFFVSGTTGTRIKYGGLELEYYYMPQQEGQLDLTLEMMESNRSLLGSFKYNTDLFDPSTINRMFSHFQTLLQSIIAHPEQRLSDLPILAETERRQLLVEWNNTEVAYSRRDCCIHQLFEAQAEQTPAAIAVVVPAFDGQEQQQLTYGELNRRANQLARCLQKSGVGPETIVGICVERSVEMIVAVLGVIKAGGAYLPLSPVHPQERLAFMLADSQAAVLLTQQSLLALFSDCAAQVVCLDAARERFAQEDGRNLNNRVTPQNLVYVTYTSGSTGRSKGVMIEHRSLVNAYLAWEEAYQLHRLSSFLQMANFSFDVFSGDLVRALCSGGKLVLCPGEWLLAPEKLYRLMRQEAVDCAEFVPAVLRPLVEHLEKSRERFDFMRVLACGSDSWYVQEYKKLLDFCGADTRLINSFGLTEATIDSSYFEGELLDLAPDRLVPIGRPFANTQLYVLDPQGQPAPTGVPGELYVGGVNLARGYLNRPDLTAQKFVPHPFSPEPGARLYRTGDKARFLRDGHIEFLGRMDYQVKIRGFRIELGEIESVLGQHPTVRETAVITREDTPGEKRLVAYLVTDQPPPSAGELRDFLKKKLPDYMLPAAFVHLDQIPLTANGKINRRSLPAPDRTGLALEETFVAPRTPTEETLAGMWTEILNLERISIHDNFFMLGGHSLLATQVVSRVRETFQVELPLRTLFEAATIADLAPRLETLIAAAQDSKRMSEVLPNREEIEL